MNGDQYPNRKRIRLQDWNYTWSACYHVTIVTQGRIRWFGEVHLAEMQCSPLGMEAHRLLVQLHTHHAGVCIHEFVVMPDHIHLLLTLPYSHVAATPAKDHFGPRPSGSLSVIINGYKGSVTRAARAMGLPFKWLYRYDDRIVRDLSAFNRVRRYIINNPRHWRG